MPRASTWLVRAALLHLVAAFALGAVILASKARLVTPAALALLPAHLELALVGWLLQLVMGVASWIFPRRADHPRGRDQWPLAWTALVLVNAGVIAACVGSLAGEPAALALGRLFELAATLAFAAHAWPRVRPVLRA